MKRIFILLCICILCNTTQAYMTFVQTVKVGYIPHMFELQFGLDCDYDTETEMVSNCIIEWY